MPHWCSLKGLGTDAYCAFKGKQATWLTLEANVVAAAAAGRAVMACCCVKAACSDGLTPAEPGLPLVCNADAGLVLAVKADACLARMIAARAGVETKLVEPLLCSSASALIATGSKSAS